MRIAGLVLSMTLVAPVFAQQLKAELFQIPSSMQMEHRALLATLDQATREGGEVGQAATDLARQLEPHFAKEEEYALPQLGLLPKLARGEVNAEMQPAIEMAERLEADYSVMLSEHQEIRQAVLRLRDAAEQAGMEEYVRFADELALHAKNEEEILYPTAILIGDYVRMNLR